MKKINILLFVLISITISMQAQTQYSVRRIIRAEFIAGNITIPNDTLCNNSPSQQITGTAATGGKPTPATTYQWQKWTSVSPIWANVIGQTGLNLQTGILSSGDYQWRRIDTNPGCGLKDTTNTIMVHIWGVFTPGTATGGGNFCDGDMGTLTTCTPATGGNPATTIQEVQTSPNGTVWTNTGNMTLNYTPIGAMHDDIYVRWKFTDDCGIVYSNIILYHVYDPLVAGTISTTTVSPLCYGANGGTATATVATGGASGTTVEWQTSIDGVTFTNTGNHTLSYSLGNLFDPVWIRSVYTNTCGIVYSNVLFFDVYDMLDAGGIPILVGMDTICLNTDPGSINAPAAIGGSGIFSYQWQHKLGTGSWSNISGATQEDYDIPIITVAGNHQYQRIATNTCGNVISPATAVYVYPQFNAGVIGNHEEVCSDGIQSSIIEITPASGGSGSYSYRWFVSINNETSFTIIVGEIATTYSPGIIYTPVDVIYYYRREVTDNGGCGVNYSTAPNLP